MENATEILFTRQRHEAKRAGLHYDIRLVHGDLAYSWATRKETPKPGENILIYEQPVHTRSYALSKEVHIPDGQYGAGITKLVEVKKAKVHPDSTEDKIKFTTQSGESYLMLKLLSGKYGKNAWLFRNITKK